MRKMLALVITLLMLLPLAPYAALAADVEGSSSFTGKVTVRASQPTVSFAFYEDSGYTTTTTQFTPQVPVYMKISLTTSNQLGEATIVVHLYADNDNTARGPIPSTTSPETYVRFTIQYDGTQWTLTPDTGGSTTWTIQFDGNQPLPDPTAYAGDFYIVITFGKTAREANTGDTAPYADWDVFVEATVGSTGLDATGTAESFGYTVFFYSEVSVGASTVDFGTLEAGQSSTIQQVDGNPGDSITASVIANGYYDLKMVSDSSWYTSDGYTITLTTGTPSTGQFRLEVDPTDNFVDATDAAVVGDALSTAGVILNDQSPTTETGVSHTLYMRITLGPNGIHTGTYTGTLTLYAVDGS